MPALLEYETTEAVTATKKSFTARERLVQNVERAFKNASVQIMPLATEQRLMIIWEKKCEWLRQRQVRRAEQARKLARYLGSVQGQLLYLFAVVTATIAISVATVATAHFLTGVATAILCVTCCLAASAVVYILLVYRHVALPPNVPLFWEAGVYSLERRAYRMLNPNGVGVHWEWTHPEHARLAARLERELRKVPGLSYQHVVYYLFEDPIGAIQVDVPGEGKRVFSYCDWQGKQLVWPAKPGLWARLLGRV